MNSKTEISSQQLNQLIGTPNCPMIIDVRIDEDFNDEPYLIPTAIRHPFTEIQQICVPYRDTTVVIYCQKGLKISQGAVAILRNLGISAKCLIGGQFAWRDADLPMIPFESIPARNPKNHTVWVAAEGPSTEVLACCWLIRRFIDHNALFLFVSPNQVNNVAEKFNATPIATKDSNETTQNCCFNALIKDFKLNNETMNQLAMIVHGACTEQQGLHELPEQSAGLLAISSGLSQLHDDDLTLLSSGILVYDALYHWLLSA